MSPKSRTRYIVEGGVYKVPSAADCKDRGIDTDITKAASGHMVLVLGRKPGQTNCWRVATVYINALQDISERWP